RCSSSLHSTHSSSTQLARSPPSPLGSSALGVSPAAASHSPDWSGHSPPPCSPPTLRSSTSSRSSTPCPCNSPSPDWRSSCTLHRSSSPASRCSSSLHSTHSSSTPLARSPPSPPDSSAPPADSCSTLYCRSSSKYSGLLCLLPSLR